MGTKREELESATGCLAKAADDEPIFVLRAQDETAPKAVRAWVENIRWILRGSPQLSDVLTLKLAEAEVLADRMEQWQKNNSCKTPD